MIRDVVLHLPEEVISCANNPLRLYQKPAFNERIDQQSSGLYRLLIRHACELDDIVNWVQRNQRVDVAGVWLSARVERDHDHFMLRVRHNFHGWSAAFDGTQVYDTKHVVRPERMLTGQVQQPRFQGCRLVHVMWVEADFFGCADATCCFRHWLLARVNLCALSAQFGEQYMVVQDFPQRRHQRSLFFFAIVLILDLLWHRGIK